MLISDMGPGSLSGGRGLQGEGVQFTTHPATQGGIDDLVLLDAADAPERFADHIGCVVIPITGQILNVDGGTTAQLTPRGTWI